MRITDLTYQPYNPLLVRESPQPTYTAPFAFDRPSIDQNMVDKVVQSVRTEEHAHHDQAMFISNMFDENMCGTSACVAGHAFIVYKGGVQAAVEAIGEDNDWQVYGFAALTGLSASDVWREIERNPMAWTMLMHLCDDVFFEFDEHKALSNLEQFAAAYA